MTAVAARRPSGAQRILNALRGGPKTASELYALHAIVHSRVAGLRKKGHVISCVRLPDREGADAFLYTLEFDAAALSESGGHGAQGEPATALGSSAHETPALSLSVVALDGASKATGADGESSPSAWVASAPSSAAAVGTATVSSSADCSGELERAVALTLFEETAA